jgi:hypothetical protein
MNVKEIVKKYLDDNGFDGLYNEDCGCLKDDLAPCGEILYDCEAGYKQNLKDPDFDFFIGPNKP